MPSRDVQDESDTSIESCVAGIPMPAGRPPAQATYPTDVKHTIHGQARSLSSNESIKMAQPNVEASEKSVTRFVHKDTIDLEIPAKTSYSAAPVMRNLQEEAVTFLPKAIQHKGVTRPREIRSDSKEHLDPSQVVVHRNSRTDGTELSSTKPAVPKRLNIAP
jgi:hypothetical protein